jgi:hypothetical protein
MADKKLCFVIGPIGAAGSEPRTHADWLLNGIIRPVMKDNFPDFEVQRADEIKAPGDINSQIINRLMDAALVIADMSMHNANAFYELAIRHMVRLPTIHITHVDWKIPFDVAPYRAIHFARAEFSDIETARAELLSVVKEVIAPGFVVENPITHARARIEIDNHATPEIQALIAEVAALREKVESEASARRNAAVIAALMNTELSPLEKYAADTRAADAEAAIFGTTDHLKRTLLNRLAAQQEPSAIRQAETWIGKPPSQRKKK